MAISTGVQFCDSTLNLEMGCDGCELWIPKLGVKKCYAGKLTQFYGGANSGWPSVFEEPKLYLDRLKQVHKWPDLRGKDRPDKPWLNGFPRMIFLDDLGDTFTESLPLDWLAPLLPEMSDMPVVWMLLTKRANRMLEFSKTWPFPENFWLYVSVTSMDNRARVEQLLETRGGSVKGISYEPAWGPVNFSPWLQRGIRHVLCGGESGADPTPFDLKWARDTISYCRGHEAAPFIKQLGADPFVDVACTDRSGVDQSTGLRIWPHSPTLWRGSEAHTRLADKKGGDPSEWPAWARVREMPR